MKHHGKSWVKAGLLTGLVWGIFVYPCLAFDVQGGVMSKIKQAKEKMAPDQQVAAPIPVPKNVVEAKEPYQGGTFYTLTRKSEISRFKCSSCHKSDTVTATNAAAISHGEIRVVHGPKGAPFSCYTCHSKADRDFLVSADDPRIDFDHVYRMCGQCHFRQKKDWIGGAHGKRVSYWAGKRVVNNCTTCHNPHSPRFEKRWPATYSMPLK